MKCNDFVRREMTHKKSGMVFLRQNGNWLAALDWKRNMQTEIRNEQAAREEFRKNVNMLANCICVYFQRVLASGSWDSIISPSNYGRLRPE
jgi:hypothetical protein